MIGEGPNNVVRRFEPTEGVWRVQTGETLSEQIAFGATEVFGSQSLGLDAFGFKFDVEVQGDASGNISVLVEGVNQVMGEEFFITAPPVEQEVVAVSHCSPAEPRFSSAHRSTAGLP